MVTEFFNFGVAVLFVEVVVAGGPGLGHGLPALGGKLLFDELEGLGADALVLVGEVDEDRAKVIPVGLRLAQHDEDSSKNGVVLGDFVKDAVGQPCSEPVARFVAWRVFIRSSEISLGIVVKRADHDRS